MVLFQYQAMNAAGQSVHAQIEAADPQDAIRKIKIQGQFPTMLKEARLKKRWPAGWIRRSRWGGTDTTLASPAAANTRLSFGRISTRALSDFTTQLSTLQDAGLPIVRSLKILHQQERRGPMKNTLATLAASVEEGLTLSESMARHPKAFNRLYINMVRAGESGGVLDVILQRLAEFMEKSQRLKRRITGAMIYPAVVICFSVLIVLGIMVFVVPRFQDIFKDFRADLPALTVALMRTADFIANRYGWLLILAAPPALFFLYKLTIKNTWGRHVADALALRLPILGRIVRKTATARFSRTLGTLLTAGVPILEAITITRDTVGNSLFENALQNVHDSIREGSPFAAPLRATRICDPIVTNMIDVGEETGDLDKMLTKIADTYDEQVDVLVGSLVSLLEPVMVITLGAMVGSIVTALFLPLVVIMQKMGNGG